MAGGGCLGRKPTDFQSTEVDPKGSHPQQPGHLDQWYQPSCGNHDICFSSWHSEYTSYYLQCARRLCVTLLVYLQMVYHMMGFDEFWLTGSAHQQQSVLGFIVGRNDDLHSLGRRHACHARAVQYGIRNTDTIRSFWPIRISDGGPDGGQCGQMLKSMADHTDLRAITASSM